MEKLRIVVCDDELVDLNQIMQLLQEYDRQQQFQITTYVSAADVLQGAKAHPFDVALLDIEMPPPTGFTVAKQLIALPDAPVILFTTKSNAYTLKGYGIALRYLQKPVERQELFEAMDAAISEATAHRLTLQTEESTFAIRTREVRYIDVFGHYVVVHTGAEEIRMRCTLKEIVARLPRRFFAVPHKSFVVNMEHIHSATASEIRMEDGTRIPISRKKSAEFNQAFHRFLGR